MRELESLERVDGNCVRWRGRRLLYFAGCDYFGLSRHWALKQAVASSLDRLGLNVAASRLTTGQHPIYEALESCLASFFAVPAALLVPTGYLTSTVVAQGMAGEFDRVLIDERSHPALQDAALQFGERVTTFRHRDALDLKRKMHRAGNAARVAVLTDGMFSLDGSTAPLRAYLNCLPAYAMLMVDDAHGAGILGRNGRGTPEHEGVDRDHRLVQCVTLSKAFGVYGGAVLGTKALRKRILTRSRAFIGCTPLPPPVAQAALRSVRLLERGHSRRRRLHGNADNVKLALRRTGFEIPDFPGPIISLVAKNRSEKRKLVEHLLDAGIYPSFLRYTGMGEGLFRFVISSEHTREQLSQLVEALIGFKGAGRSAADKGTGPAR